MVKLSLPGRKPFYKIETLNSLYENALSKSEVSESEFDKFFEKDLYYYLFENAFYNKEIITRIQKSYVQFVPKNTDKYFLDAGCGRGEFLELLRDNGIKAKGVEINSVECKILKDKGFDVELNDIVNYLNNTEEVFSGISAIEVVEHLSFQYLYDFIHLAYEHIEQGGIILLETLNCKNVSNLKNFYTDLTHVKPVTMESLQFLCEKAGFKKLQVCKSFPHKHGYINYAIIGEK